VNTKYKSGKIIWIVLAIVLIAFLTVSVWLALPIFKDDYDAKSDTAVSKTSVVKLFKEKPYIVASSAEKAAAYAEKLGIPANQYNYVDSTIVLRVEDGVWKGMANSDVLGKYTHLLLPNDITSIDAGSISSANGIYSVLWLSIMADDGCNLTSIPGATSSISALGRGWLERVDLTKATKLTSIPAYTFKTCDRLQDIAFPDTITSIGAQAIVSANLCHISLPSGLGADGGGLDWNAFQGCGKLVDIGLPSNANATFENKVKGMTSIWETYMNVYVEGSGRSWLARTVDGFVFCKNLSRTTQLATGLTSNENYTIGKWYLVGYHGPESGGDTVNASDTYMMTLPKQVDLAKESSSRLGQYDFIDCSGNLIQNDFSDLTTQTQLGSNVAVNSVSAGDDTIGSRVIAGMQSGVKLKYDVGQLAFFYRWTLHTTIPDDAVSTIGNRAFHNASVTTFNIGNVEKIGNRGLAFLGRSAGLSFYLPSNNPMIAGDGFSYNTSSGPVGTRLFIYRDYTNYDKYYINSAGSADSGLQKAAKDIAAGVGKYYSYLIDVVPNIAEWDNDANAYRYTTVDEAKMQRLYTGNLAGFDGGGIYNNAFSYTRTAYDTWEYDASQAFPSLSEHTGYSKTNWFTSTTFDTKYTESLISTADNSSSNLSLRNAASKATDIINIYSRKIVTVTLENKVREYKDRSLQADETEITGIPTAIKGDYEVEVTKYVDSNGVEKSYSSIGSIIQEAGIYTIQIQPNEAFGQWTEGDVPTMTVTVNKTELDLGDSSIFRLGVTDGINQHNLRPGKEVEGEQGTSLYKYKSSWYTEMQTDDTLGDLIEQRDGLWNSFVRAEGEEMKFRLALITGVIQDAHDSSIGIFDINMPGTARSESGEYTDQFTVELTEKAKNNYRFVVTNDASRQFYGYANSDQSIATINKTWYIVKLNNWLTIQGYEGNIDAPSYHMLSSWEFGTASVPKAPAVALGTDVHMTFSLELTSQHIVGGSGTLILSTDENGDPITIDKYSRYINSSMPAGSYRIIYSVDFSNDDHTKFDTFQQSFTFTIYDKAFVSEENDAINQLKGKTFEYDMKEATNSYNQNKVLFDLNDLSSTDKLEDMLGLNGETTGNTHRVGIWAERDYDVLFDRHFTITYNLNRMWNNTYKDLTGIQNDYPMNTPDVYTVYYQLTCKNRKSLVNENDDARRQCCFYVVVYRTLTAPTIQDVTYTGSAIYPTVSYLNGELAFEQSYYTVSYPTAQDNVNNGVKKAVLTISDRDFQLYRWADGASIAGDEKTLEITYSIVAANNSTTVPLYMADWSWNSNITLDNIVWETKFGNVKKDFEFMLVPVRSGENDNRENVTDISKFGTADAGVYTLHARCPADEDGNWKEYEQTLTITVFKAINTWYKSPSITSWSWNQYENYDWSLGSPIQIHAVPTYYSTSTESKAGSGRFDFRIYSLKNGATGDDIYDMVYFDDDFHFQFDRDADGNFLTHDGDPKEGGHFLLPIYVAKKLASLPAGQYYLVATVYDHNNYTGLNNAVDSFGKGAVQFTVAPANNIWSDTITASDWAYSEFELGRHLHIGTTKYATQLKYALYYDDTTDIVTADGVRLENITDFSATASGSKYTYAQLVSMLDVGSYMIKVHGDAAEVNERGGINYLAIDDQRKVTVIKAANTLNDTFAVNSYTIGSSTDGLIAKYTARFESQKVGFRISQSGVYVDGLSNTHTSDDIIQYSLSLNYDELLQKISQLSSTETGSQYTVWWTTVGGDNYTAQYGSRAFAVYLGQNGWVGDVIPTMTDWTYDGAKHEFDKSSVKLTHPIADADIKVTYYAAIYNEHTGKNEKGLQIDGCPIDTGNYFVTVTIPTDDYYRGMSVDLFFTVSMANNSFKTSPAINNSAWDYSQLDIDDIIIGEPSHKEDDMNMQYVVYQTIASGEDIHIATLNWRFGRVDGSNAMQLDDFYKRLKALNVGEYKLYITLSSSSNFKELVIAPTVLNVYKAANGYADGKAPAIIDNVTQWEWDKYDSKFWQEVATKFGEISIFIDSDAVASLSVSNHLSRLETGEHEIRFYVKGTDNYEGFDETRTFTIVKNKNGWTDGEKDKTAFVNDWTWGDYDNDISGGNPIWKEPSPNYGKSQSQAAIYKGRDGVGGTLIKDNIALYSLDIVMNSLDAGHYYLIWTVVGDSNYETITREYINFEVKVNPNKWDPSQPATMHENDKKEISGIEYGWTWGEFGKDTDVDYFTVPHAEYGLVVAKVTKYDSTWSNPQVIVDGISNHISISNALNRLDVGRYRIEWSATDPNATGNFEEINYPTAIEFIVNRGVNAWTGDKPYIDGWQWGAFDSSLWKAPGLVSGRPNATVIKLNSDGTDGEHIIEKLSSEYLSAQLALLEVGDYRLVWTADDNDNYEIEGENKDDLIFQVSVNVNGWTIEPKITAQDSQWQWKTFTLGYWQRPEAQYHHNDISATVYKLKDGYDFEYDEFNKVYILDESKCTVMSGITLATLDAINDLSVGKYLVKVCVPEDENGRFLGLQSVLPFTVVPNENDFTSRYCYINGYAYSQFRGYWSAPTAQFGEIIASIYIISNGTRELVATSSVSDLNNALSELHVGNYEVDWTISEDSEGNYLGGKTTTSSFAVSKTENRWVQKPVINGWAWGEFNAADSGLKAIPFKIQEGQPLYFKIVDVSYNELSDFDGHVDEMGYFTDISKVADILNNLKPAVYHLLAYYPELDDYKKLDADNDCTFVVRHAENKWVMTPDIIDWVYGSPANKPIGSAVFGEEIKYTYYRAVLDAFGEPVFENGRYLVEENSAFGGWGKDEIADAGVYIVQADVAGNEYYAPLSTQFVLRVSNSKYNFWKTQPIIQSWVFGSDKCLPEGEAAYGSVTWTYYKAAWSDALNKWVPTGEALSTDGQNPPEEVGKYILVASVAAAEGYNALIANVFFEVYERATSAVSSDVLVYIDIALAALASIFTTVVIIAVVRRYRRNDSVNE
jgi:hypothetical protein